MLIPHMHGTTGLMKSAAPTVVMLVSPTLVPPAIWLRVCSISSWFHKLANLFWKPRYVFTNTCWIIIKHCLEIISSLFKDFFKHCTILVYCSNVGIVAESLLHFLLGSSNWESNILILNEFGKQLIMYRKVTSITESSAFVVLFCFAFLCVCFWVFFSAILITTINMINVVLLVQERSETWEYIGWDEENVCVFPGEWEKSVQSTQFL